MTPPIVEFVCLWIACASPGQEHALTLPEPQLERLCRARVRCGNAFLDPGRGNIHFAVNDSDQEVVVYATFIDIPPGQAPTQLLEAPGDCAL